MNTLSSLSPLSPASFADLAPRGSTQPEMRQFAPGNELQTLHVGAETLPRALDDIEHDFLAALCESHPA